MILEAGDASHPVYWKFQDTPLKDALYILNKEIGWSVWLGPSSLVDGKTVTLTLDGVPAGEALGKVLALHDLGLWFRPEYHGYVDARPVRGVHEFPSFSKVTSTFRVVASLPGEELQISLASDGTTARWRILPLALQYAWCGNSYDHFFEGQMEQSLYESLWKQSQRLVWGTKVTADHVVWPQGIYTLQSDAGWYRSDRQSSPEFRHFLERLFASLPGQNLRPLLGESPDLWSYVEAGKIQDEVATNASVLEAFAKPFQADHLVDISADDQACAEVFAELGRQAGGNIFVGPGARSTRVTYRCKARPARNVLSDLLAQTGLKVELERDLILVGQSEELRRFPKAMRVGRSLELPRDTAWTHLDLPQELSSEQEAKLRSAADIRHTPLSPDPAGGWRALGSPRDIYFLRSSCQEIASPDRDERLVAEMDDDVGWYPFELACHYLSQERALEVLRQAAPSLEMRYAALASSCGAGTQTAVLPPARWSIMTICRESPN